MDFRCRIQIHFLCRSMDASGCSKIVDGKPIVLFGIPSDIYGLQSGRAGNGRQKMPEFQCPPNHTSNKANREMCMYARFDQSSSPDSILLVPRLHNFQFLGPEAQTR
ncbi:hypothetical protein WG66_005592 [Moniliophthora roreri]|nr:hypothetical protein WG66_005592 [Moniliophthora roreri]